MGVRNRTIAGWVLVALGCGGRSVSHRPNDGNGTAGGTGGVSAAGGTDGSSSGSGASGGVVEVGGGRAMGGTGTGGGDGAVAGRGAAMSSQGGEATAATGGANAQGGQANAGIGAASAQGGEAGTEACGDTHNDARNCGACGNVCDGHCSYGHCVGHIADQLVNSACVALDSENVYFGTADLDEHIGRIWRAKRGGGTPVLMVSGLAPLWTCKLAIDAKNLYVASQSDAQVIQVPLDKSPARMLAQADYAPLGIAVWGSDVYFAESYGAIRCVHVDGGSITTLANDGGQLEGFAIDDTYAYWTTRDGTAITGRLRRVPLLGGGVQPLLADVPTGTGLTVDDESVYWVDYSGGNVFGMPKAGGAVSTLASNLPLAGPLVHDRSSLFVAALGGIYQVPIGGGTGVPFSSGTTVFDMAIDERSLFFTNGTSVGEILLK